MREGGGIRRKELRKRRIVVDLVIRTNNNKSEDFLWLIFSEIDPEILNLLSSIQPKESSIKLNPQDPIDFLPNKLKITQHLSMVGLDQSLAMEDRILELIGLNCTN
jgi:hypothetical protein